MKGAWHGNSGPHATPLHGQIKNSDWCCMCCVFKRGTPTPTLRDNSDRVSLVAHLRCPMAIGPCAQLKLLNATLVSCESTEAGRGEEG